ncbi:MAG TPA: metalloregulator ArsR/SmtB family transcription factor [Xanthomonadaceae bacterium]|nr:metalloregulator ArsR/SmtB family transcription factor [Xanthomonadaceae bacterium]
MDLSATAALLKLLSDGTRVRLLALLEAEELTVAELSSVTGLAQPRVSTHLAKLKEADLVRDRRAGVSAYYRINGDLSGATRDLWQALRAATDDALLEADAARLPAVLATRAREQNWPDTVAGDMERHYSPGRTWEAFARAAVQLLELGDVLDLASGDGVTAELLAPRAHTLTCVDTSPRVVEAARARLAGHRNVRVLEGDMHALALPDASFDLVLLVHALTYAERPQAVFAEVARVLRAGGRLLACTLAKHRHQAAVAPYDHRNLGFAEGELKRMCARAGLAVIECGLATRERRPPHFEVLTLLARKP